MKSQKDPRHLKRIALVKELFTDTFNNPQLSSDVQAILAKKEELDAKIQKAAPQWPIAKINRVDLAVLRLAVFELMDNKNPHKVVIDEAIEIAKRYGSESSPGFVNGVLGAVVNNSQYVE